MLHYRPSPKFDKDVSVILIEKEQLKERKFNFQSSEIQRQIESLNRGGHFQAENRQAFPLIIKNKVVILVGLGSRKELTSRSLRMTVRSIFMCGFAKRAKSVEIIMHDHNEETVRALIEAIVIGTYQWKKYISINNGNAPVSRDYYLITQKKNIYEEIEQTCSGVNCARDLINDNADTVTSEFLEKTIRSLLKGKKGVALAVLNKKELAAKGLYLHLAVNRGSTKEPKLIIVQYNGAPNKKDVTALIGKGMTFDTGGLNIKPTGSMETMRMDMSGAAAVIGVLKNVLSLRPKKNILFVCGIAENVTDANSYKPGDVVVGYAGKSVEVGNTDAEGRLVLADAIAYIVKNYKPSRIIDIATLTGACVVALGYDYSGLMANDDELSRQLVRSSNVTDDRIWRLPLYPELKDAVKSPIADIKNLGFPKGAAGTITAAEFLRQFTGDTSWAHLDIAGTAYVDDKERSYFSHGGTGAGVRLLTHYLQHN